MLLILHSNLDARRPGHSAAGFSFREQPQIVHWLLRVVEVGRAVNDSVDRPVKVWPTAQESVQVIEQETLYFACSPRYWTALSGAVSGILIHPQLVDPVDVTPSWVERRFERLSAAQPQSYIRRLDPQSDHRCILLSMCNNHYNYLAFSAHCLLRVSI